MIAICCATADDLAFRAAGAITMAVLGEGSSPLLRRHDRDSVAVPSNEMLAAVAGRADLEAVLFVHQCAVVEREVDVLALVRHLTAAGDDVAAVGVVDGPRTREIAAADATLLALTPWTARNLAFDPAVGGSPDAAAWDLSLRARQAGRRILGAPLGIARARAERSGPVERRRELGAMVAFRRRWNDDVLSALA